jgi:zinc transport system permease protein
MINAIFEYRFLQNAMLAGIVASIVCGIIGVIIVEKKLVMMSGGIAHTSYAGVGLGYFLGFEPIIGAFIFSVLAATGIYYLKKKAQARPDVSIGLFWSLGMALGIIFIALTPGYPPDLNSYLFGNILSVTRTDLYMTGGLAAFVVLAVSLFYNHWKAYLFDDEFAGVLGIKTSFLGYLLYILTAMTVVALIKVVGIILVLALLLAPSAISGLFCEKLFSRMICSIIFGIIFCIGGLWFSYAANISSGASIVIISVLCCAAAYAVRNLTVFRRKKEAKNEQLKPERS